MYQKTNLVIDQGSEEDVNLNLGQKHDDNSFSNIQGSEHNIKVALKNSDQYIMQNLNHFRL